MNKVWTGDDFRTLRQALQHGTVADAARMLGQPEQEVEDMARDLGLLPRPQQ